MSAVEHLTYSGNGIVQNLVTLSNWSYLDSPLQQRDGHK